MRLRPRHGREAACRLAGFSAVSRRRARRLDSAEMSVGDGCATEREPSGGTREAAPSAPMHPELGLPARSIRRGPWPGSPRRGPPACSRGARRSQGRARSGPSPPVGGVGFSAESRRRALAVCVSIRQRCASPSVSAGTPRSEHGGPEIMRGGRAGETLASPPALAISSRFRRDARARHSSARPLTRARARMVLCGIETFGRDASPPGEPEGLAPLSIRQRCPRPRRREAGPSQWPDPALGVDEVF